MRIIERKNISQEEYSQLLKRPSINIDATCYIVKPILSDIKKNGLNAVLTYAQKFDGFSGKEIRISEEEIIEAEKELDAQVKSAINTTAQNIRKFHEQQKPQPYSIETMPGVVCRREFRAIENVGLYIPGGSAVLPSTMLMLGIPASLAGCRRIVAVSPAKEGKLNDSVLYAAKICGITEIYKVGGAQAIAMLAYGVEGISKVDKIFGPGNQYVTAAKTLVSSDPDGAAIDMPAGPSEVLVIADSSANPAFVAADLLSQAEHGSDSQVVLVTTEKSLAENALKEINVQLKVLPRNEFAVDALKNSFALVVDSIDEAIEFSNQYAPEHLIMNFKDAAKFSDRIQNAGSVFIGSFSPESAGDYSSGTNHSLPTYGYARSYGGVSVEMFMKAITFQEITKEGLENLSDSIITLAETEKLEAHANAVKVRLK